MSELVKGMLEGKSSLVGPLRSLYYFYHRRHHHISQTYIKYLLFPPFPPSLSFFHPEDADDEDVTEIPLPNVKAAVLRKVIEFCQHHKTEPMTEIEKPLKSAQMAEVVQKWYADFVAVEQVLLFELILAANYMDIKPLLDLTCATVASMIKGKTPEEIRKTFNIANDFSPEEEAQVREENKWCEEP